MTRQFDPRIWEAYERWNEALATLIYSEQVAGSPAYLDLEEDVLLEAANLAVGRVEDPRQSLLDAVRATLNPSTHPAGLFGRQLVRLREWATEQSDPPPQLALLGVMSLAAEEMRRGEGFAPNNYYDRLMPLIGISSTEDKKRVINAYRACSRELWGSLNHWLEDLQGERGLPTAFSYTHAHVGLPMSQALVRAADRDRLSRFFSDSGFAPRSRVPPEEMKVPLAEWMERTPPRASKTLRRLWGNPGARERLLEITARMLETWDGPHDLKVSEEETDRTHRLSLVVLIRSFPAAGLEFNALGVGGVEDMEQLQVVDPDDDSAMGVDVAVEEVAGRRWRLIAPDAFDARSLLEGRLRLRDSAGRTFERRPRRLVPLRKDNLIQSFVETERLQLGEDGIVLCQDAIAPSVDDALRLVARPGFRRWPAGSEHCPEGWQLFQDIQVLAGLPSLNPKTGKQWPLELNELQPLVGSQVLLEGGLQFPGHVRGWSSLAPPELRVASEEASLLVMHVEQVRTLDGRVDPIERQFDSPVAVAQVKDLGLTDGDYEVTATPDAEHRQGKRRSIDTVRLRLRSGDTPSSLAQPEQPLVRDFSHPATAVITASRNELPSPPVQGPHIPTQEDDGQESVDIAKNLSVPEWWARRNEVSAARDEGPVVRIEVPAAEPSDCIHTGAHYMKLPDTVDVHGATFQGYCKQCGLVKRYPSRYRRAGRKPLSRKSATPHLPTFDVGVIPPVVTRGDVTPDVALDALTHLGRGPASSLRHVAVQIEPSQLFADSFARALEALGHVELERQPGTLITKAWETVPPVLAELPSHDYVFVGERSRRLYAALRDVVAEEGGTVVRQQQPAAPDVILIKGLPANGADQVSKNITDRTGREVLVAPEPARRLTLLLPPLSLVTGEIPRSAMVHFRSARRWNGSLARWDRVDDASVPGAYQLLSARTLYCVRDESDIQRGTIRLGDARLVKHWDALNNGASLIGYDVASGSLFTPLGAELPLLYSRPAVLSSGFLPAVDEKQRIARYSSVEPHVASRLVQLLST